MKAGSQDNSGAVVVNLSAVRLCPTAGTVGHDEKRTLQAVMGKLAAHRSAFFLLIEQAEALLGREVDVQELECLLDGEYAGRSEISEQEALAILSRAAPLRAISR